jgi:hypothetical protein
LIQSFVFNIFTFFTHAASIGFNIPVCEVSAANGPQRGVY